MASEGIKGRVRSLSAVTPSKAPVEGSGDRKIVDEIFTTHQADGDITAGSAFKNACLSLSKAFPALKALDLEAMEGRAFEVLDTNGNGLLDREEFATGVLELLSPETSNNSKVVALAKRLQKGGIGKPESTFKHVKKVAVLGAGVAGLQVCHELSKVGLEVVVYEKTDNVGGVWRDNYADFGLQVPKELFEFPGFPYPSGTEWAKFPKGPQVQKYIELFTDNFGLRKMIKFNTTIVEIQARGANVKGWTIVSGTKGGKKQTEDVDFVVVCSGMYNWPPNMPVARGADKFKGKIMHSCEFTDKAQAEGKKTIVVGGGKSAVDCAVAASKTGKEATLLFRQAHWPVPRKLAELVPFKWGTYSRFGHAMLKAHHLENPISSWLHASAKPLKWAWWRIVELMFRVQFRLKGDMVPTIPIEIDVFNGGQILDKQFRDRLAKGELNAVKGAIDHFEKDRVVLTNGKEIEADLVVYGTGFNKNYSYFDRVILDRMQMEQDGLWLYRNIIPAMVPNVAFVGCEVTTFNNILTHGLQSLWLAKLLSNQIELPTAGKMKRVVELEQAWKRSWMPAKRSRAVTYQLHMTKYHDILCNDMGVAARRKGFNLLAEVFSPYNAQDYAPLFAKGGKDTSPKIGHFHPQDVMMAILVALYIYLYHWPF